MAALVVADLLSIVLSYAAALVLRFDFRLNNIPPEHWAGYESFILPWLIATVAVFYICRLYHRIWSRVGVAEAEMIVLTYLVLIPVYLVIIWIGGVKLPVRTRESSINPS